MVAGLPTETPGAMEPAASVFTNRRPGRVVLRTASGSTSKRADRPSRMRRCPECWLGEPVESTLAVSASYMACVFTRVTSTGVAQPDAIRSAPTTRPRRQPADAGPRRTLLLRSIHAFSNLNAGRAELAGDASRKLARDPRDPAYDPWRSLPCHGVS